MEGFTNHDCSQIDGFSTMESKAADKIMQAGYPAQGG
jgi:hypothetical protein